MSIRIASIYFSDPLAQHGQQAQPFTCKSFLLSPCESLSWKLQQALHRLGYSQILGCTVLLLLQYSTVRRVRCALDKCYAYSSGAGNTVACVRYAQMYTRGTIQDRASITRYNKFTGRYGTICDGGVLQGATSRRVS